jgi:5'-phosphate synthase pdxT subunit
MPTASQPAMQIGILAVQGDFAAHARMLERLGLAENSTSRDSYRFVRTPRDLEGLEALILPGGESTTMLKFLADEAFWRKLEEFSRSKPVFGTCAGAILLARDVTHPPQRSLAALDCSIVRNAYGRQIDSSIRQGPYIPEQRNGSAGQPQPPLEMVFIRAPQFAALAPGVQILATEAGMPVLVRQKNILAATFHPELTSDTRVHQLFLDMVRQSRATAPPS